MCLLNLNIVLRSRSSVNNNAESLPAAAEQNTQAPQRTDSRAVCHCQGLWLQQTRKKRQGICSERQESQPVPQAQAQAAAVRSTAGGACCCLSSVAPCEVHVLRTCGGNSHDVQASTTVEDLHLHRIQARAGSPAQQSDSEHSDSEAQRCVCQSLLLHACTLCLTLECTVLCRQAQPAAAPQEEAELRHQTAAEQVHLYCMAAFKAAAGICCKPHCLQEENLAVLQKSRKRQRKEKPETNLQRLARHVQSDKVTSFVLHVHVHFCMLELSYMSI